MIQNNFAYNYILVDVMEREYYYRFCDDRKNIGLPIEEIYKIHNQFNEENDVYIPKWFCTRDDNCVYSTLNNLHRYCLLEMLHGEEKEIGVYDIANALLKLHDYLLRVSIQYPNYSLVSLLSKNINTKDVPKDILDVLTMSKEKLYHLGVIEMFNTIPSQIIHGDFHKNNIIKLKNRLGVIDFFNATYDARIFDISDAQDLFKNKCDKNMLLDIYIDRMKISRLENYLLQFCKPIKSIVFLMQVCENYRFNIRLKGAKETVTDSLSTLKIFLGEKNYGY